MPLNPSTSYQNAGENKNAKMQKAQYFPLSFLHAFPFQSTKLVRVQHVRSSPVCPYPKRLIPCHAHAMQMLKLNSTKNKYHNKSN